MQPLYINFKVLTSQKNKNKNNERKTVEEFWQLWHSRSTVLMLLPPIIERFKMPKWGDSGIESDGIINELNSGEQSEFSSC